MKAISSILSLVINIRTIQAFSLLTPTGYLKSFLNSAYCASVNKHNKIILKQCAQVEDDMSQFVFKNNQIKLKSEPSQCIVMKGIKTLVLDSCSKQEATFEFDDILGTLKPTGNAKYSNKCVLVSNKYRIRASRCHSFLSIKYLRENQKIDKFGNKIGVELVYPPQPQKCLLSNGNKIFVSWCNNIENELKQWYFTENNQIRLVSSLDKCIRATHKGGLYLGSCLEYSEDSYFVENTIGFAESFISFLGNADTKFIMIGAKKTRLKEMSNIFGSNEMDMSVN